jgi:hypothetical protein
MSKHRKIQVLHYFLYRSTRDYFKVIRGDLIFAVYAHGDAMWKKRWKVSSQINRGWGNCITRLHFLSTFYSVYLKVSTFLVHTEEQWRPLFPVKFSDAFGTQIQTTNIGLFNSAYLSAWKPTICVGLLRHITSLVKTERIRLALYMKSC